MTCDRCGHHADMHSGSYGCIGRSHGEDCFCTRAYTQIVPAATAAGQAQEGAQA